jgi:hypothetical protein
MFRLSLRGPVMLQLALGVASATVCVACGDIADATDDGGGGQQPSGCAAASGDYQVTYSAVSDNCGGVAALPSDRFSITDEGDILTDSGRAPGDGSAPSGCVDRNASVDACAVSFTRECASEDLLGSTADVQGSYQLDFDRRTGSVQISIRLNDGSVLLNSCTARQNVSIARR